MLQKIREFPEPESKDYVATSIGLVKTLNSWSGAMSPKMEQVMDLKKAGVAFNWEDPHKAEFSEVKEHLNKVCHIPAFDKDLPMEIFFEAAKTGGLGYILTQKEPEGNEYNII